MSQKRSPVVIERDDAPKIGPDQAAPVPELAEVASGRAMQSVARMGGRRRGALGRWFWRLLVALVAFSASLWAWDFVNAMIVRNSYLGYAAVALVGAFVAVCLGIAVREWAAFARLRQLGGLQNDAQVALQNSDLVAARQVTGKLAALYAGRAQMKWGLDRFGERAPEVLDADGLFGLAEAEILGPLDVEARLKVESAARQVATVTAIVPLALADVAVALVANVRMIRAIAEIYGGRAGTIGSWRLTRSVLAHLVATGAVAVGDDMISSIAGGSVLAKVSRRFGEGMINGALTARVGVAAIEVCRPLPYVQQKRPSVRSLVQRALTGLFSARKT